MLIPFSTLLSISKKLTAVVYKSTPFTSLASSQLDSFSSNSQDCRSEHKQDHIRVQASVLTKVMLTLGLGLGTSLAYASFNPKQFYPTAQVSIYAINLATGKEVINYNSTEMMRPASTLKILTALRAYQQFGANYSFTTKVWADSKLTTSGTVNGNVTVEFVGDPSINTYTLTQLMKQLKATGIKRITGNLIVNVGRFSGHQYPIGWLLSNQGICFSSNVGAGMYNYNCITGTLDPWDKFGQQAKLTYSNQKDVKAISDVVIKPEEYTDSCEINYEVVDKNTFSIDGCMIRAKQKLWLHLAVPNGNYFTASTVASRFQDNGISFNRLILDNHKFYARGKTLLLGYDGYSVGRLLKTMLQDSENHIAETLFRNYAFAKTHQPVNYTIAQTVNAQGLKDLGFTFPYLQVDGSGLSSYNLISAQGLVAVMSYIYIHRDSMQLYSYFAHQNEGTLAYHNGLKSFNVVGKTGTIEGANNFVGVTYNKQNQPIVFAYLVNNNLGDKEDLTLEKFERGLLTTLTHSSSSAKSHKFPSNLIPASGFNGIYLAPQGSKTNAVLNPRASLGITHDASIIHEHINEKAINTSNIAATDNYVTEKLANPLISPQAVMDQVDTINLDSEVAPIKLEPTNLQVNTFRGLGTDHDRSHDQVGTEVGFNPQQPRIDNKAMSIISGTELMSTTISNHAELSVKSPLLGKPLADASSQPHFNSRPQTINLQLHQLYKQVNASLHTNTKLK